MGSIKNKLSSMQMTRLWHQVAWLFLVAIIYWIMVRIGLLFVAQPEGIASIWPASGLALAILLLSPKRQWAKWLAVIFLTNAWGNWSSGNPLLVSLGFALANTLEPLLSAWALTYFCKPKVTFERAWEILVLFGVTILCNGLTASLGAAVSMLAFGAPFLRTWQLWLASNGLGMILVAPLIVTWATGQYIFQSVSSHRLVEASVLILVLVVFAVVLFGPFTVAEDPILRGYMLFPILIWLAFSYSSRGLTAALILFAFIAIGNTLRGHGVFAFSDQTVAQHLAAVQIFLGVTTFSGLLLSAMVTERRQAEEELYASEERFHSFYTNSLVGMYRTTPDGHILLSNPALVEMLGYESFDELAKRNLEMESETGYRRSEFREKIEREGSVRGLEATWKRKDGTQIFVRESASIGYDANGKVAYYEGTVEDITDRRQAEEKLRLSEEKFRKAFLTSPDSININRAKDGMFISINQGFTQIMGYTEADAIGKTSLEINVWEDPNDRKKLVDMLKQNGEVHNFEARFQAKNGSIKYGLMSASIIELEGVPHILSITRDISERKQAEQTLQKRAHELQTLYEISLEISAQTSLEKLLSSIVKKAATLLDTDSGGLYLMEPDGQYLRLVVGHNLPEKYINNVTLKLGEGLSGRVAQNSASIMLDDYQAWPGRALANEGTAFRRTLGIPLIVKNTVIGVLNVSDFISTDPFTEEEVRLVSLFADQAALAIENARLHEQEHKRNRELATLYESAMALSSNLSLEVVLKAVAEQMTRAINTDGCAISFLDQERDTLITMVDYRTVSQNTADISGTIYPLKNYPATRHVLETRQPLFESRYDPQTDPAEQALMENLGMSAELLLPLVARNQVIGLMELYETKNKARTFTDDEIRLAQSLSVQTAIFIDNARLYEHAERRLRQTEALHTVDMAIASSTDVGLVFNVIFGQIVSQLEVDAAIVLLYNSATQTLEYKAGRGFHSDALQHTSLHIGEGHAGRAALTRQIVHITNLKAHKTGFLRSPSFSQEEFVSYTGVPLIAKGELKGVLEVFHRSAFETESEWLNFLETLAGQTAIAIDNAQLFESLQRSNFELTLSYDATIEGWSHAIGLHDKESEGHTQRVTDLTLQLARQMGTPEVDMLQIRRGALLHDIGKMGVPDSILLKPGPLTEAELTLIHRCPIYAYEMLSPIPYLKRALDIPYCHREKWDGTGYPQGLKGSQIPLAARIFAVVDVWDALISDRPYRPAWTREKAIAYIKEQSGKHFDPEVIQAFLQIIAGENL